MMKTPFFFDLGTIFFNRKIISVLGLVHFRISAPKNERISLGKRQLRVNKQTALIEQQQQQAVIVWLEKWTPWCNTKFIRCVGLMLIWDATQQQQSWAKSREEQLPHCFRMLCSLASFFLHRLVFFFHRRGPR
jgi:hypothetical protein